MSALVSAAVRPSEVTARGPTSGTTRDGTGTAPRQALRDKASLGERTGGTPTTAGATVRVRVRAPARQYAASAPSDSGSSSGSDSEDSRERRHRKKKSSSRSKDKLDSKGRTKEERRERREEKKAKKEKKLRKKKGLAVVEWGKHGLIGEQDIYTKDQEFRAWLVSEKMLNPETLSKAKSKEVFKTFMEEFNTGTLPHDKYYDMNKYEARMNSLRNGESVTVSDKYDPNKDLEDARASHRRSGPVTDTFLDRAKLESLRQVQSERIQMERMKRIGMQPKDSMGVRMDMEMK
ncbi:hypothetical protein RQP46_000344 [Phenoliferia psychrophenolica]